VPAVLAYASDAPPDPRTFWEPPALVGVAVYAEATLLEPARVGPQVVGGCAVVDQTSTGGQ
jgi:hypothetical protein